MSSESPDPTLGSNLRRLRKASGLSIANAAAQTEMSESFLSLVERGQSDLSLGRLGRLLALYEGDWNDVVPSLPHGDDTRSPDVVRAGDELVFVSYGEQISASLLTKDTARQLTPMLWVYEPGGATEVRQANPTDVFTHVLEGTLTYEDESGTTELHPGDTVYIRAGASFQFRNAGAVRARALGCGVNPQG